MIPRCSLRRSLVREQKMGIKKREDRGGSGRVPSTEMCKALCTEAIAGSMLGICYGDTFAEVVAVLGSPDAEMNGPHHVRYGVVEIAADPAGVITLIYAELPAELFFAIGLLSESDFDAGDVRTLGSARFVFDPLCGTVSVDVFRRTD